jgi:hypothetical protein
MRHVISAFIAIAFLSTLLPQTAAATDDTKLENRIKGWISSVNEGNYLVCLRYVAPPRFTGGKGLTRAVSGGEEVLLFSGQKLLPFSEYQIHKIEYLNDGYESKVTIHAKVLYHNRPIYLQKNGAISDYDLTAYPATVTQRWVFLNEKWFIKSVMRLQYLGSLHGPQGNAAG